MKIPIGVIVLLIMFTSCTNTYVGRWIVWNFSAIDDYKKFPAHEITNAPPVFHFYQSSESFMDSITYRYKAKEGKTSLTEFLEANGTTAFLVIRNDTILYENYFNGYDRESINTSFSVAKSITSLLVGIAIDEGYISNVHDPVTKYIPELRMNDARYDAITLEHLLSMQSGIRFRDHEFITGDKPKAYYHPDLRKMALSRKIESEPGDKFSYNTYNPIILGIVLERTTYRPVAEYFEEKIWSRLGMEFDASWSLDSERSRMTKMESGINARAIDFAKLGKLILNNGRWNGEQIVSEEWIQKFQKINHPYEVHHIRPDLYYNRAWWLHHRENEDHAYAVAGWGHLGQYLYIFPDKNLIIVRFGKRLGKVDSWARVFEEMYEIL